MNNVLPAVEWIYTLVSIQAEAILAAGRTTRWDVLQCYTGLRFQGKDLSLSRRVRPFVFRGHTYFLSKGGGILSESRYSRERPLLVAVDFGLCSQDTIEEMVRTLETL